MLTANFLNHFFTSALMLPHSLTAILANFASTSASTSKIVAVALRAFADVSVSSLLKVDKARLAHQRTPHHP